MQQNKRIPYGYSIHRGTPVIIENEAVVIRAIFQAYIEGATLEQASARAGVSFSRSRTTHILHDPHYCGDDHYPAIIDQGTYDRAQAISSLRNPRTNKSKGSTEQIQEVITDFSWSSLPDDILNDATLSPTERANILYTIIKSRSE